MHFPKCGRPIGEELEAQLAIGDIERAIGKWQLVSTGFVPLYTGASAICRNRSGDVQHAGIEIDSGYRAARSDPSCRDACHNPSAASYIDDALARAGMSKLHHDGSPWPKDSGAPARVRTPQARCRRPATVLADSSERSPKDVGCESKYNPMQRCQLWVISGQTGMRSACPLYPQKRILGHRAQSTKTRLCESISGVARQFTRSVF